MRLINHALIRLFACIFAVFFQSCATISGESNIELVNELSTQVFRSKRDVYRILVKLECIDAFSQGDGFPGYVFVFRLGHDTYLDVYFQPDNYLPHSRDYKLADLLKDGASKDPYAGAIYTLSEDYRFEGDLNCKCYIKEFDILYLSEIRGQ